MTTTRRRVLAGIGAAAATSACARNTDPNVLTMWAMGREAEVVGEVLPGFLAEHPGVRVEIQMLPWTAAHERLLTAFVGDSLPDIAQLGNTWIPEFSSLNALEPLDARVSGSSIDQADYFPGIWNTNLYGDTLYGVPWYVDTRVLFYRRDILQRAGVARVPQTWPDWRAAMEAVKLEVGPQNFSVLLPLNEFEPMLALGLQQDEPLLRDQNTRGNFQSEGFKQTLAFYKALFDDGLAPPSSNTQISNVYSEFDRGYFSFYITGPWNIGEFQRRLPADRQDTWMTAPLPGPRGPGASIAGGSSLVVFRTSPKKELAWALTEYLSRPEVQIDFHAKTGDLPPRRSVWETSTLADDPYMAAFRDQLERAKAAPPVPEWERIADELRLVGESMVHGEMDVEQGAAALNARADRILEKRRWMVSEGRAV
ncbi:sugar ABC transporter substrate-binding protein [Terricaulis silvestris]|uniref:Putative arabinose-binding protein n=1 Tax=Terricaulis silvestris TaxID=2686094 RepID=A0A6I6MJE0_9CAUL|nr:sugar ABC transporter substrate-binding protein [Terricaulis silvestris]QGZ94789.1 putative arabinose-binding protein precursor [Terricaulis silvestris]